MTAFHPIIQKWFSERYGEPTDIQSTAWPKIAEGRHLLITAPTGSGKTLTAFLWTLNRFITGDLKPGKTRVLYISPLKALNNDIQKNLLGPLAELKQAFEEESEPFPAINVATRSGDTDQDQRRAMLRHPPEILITTPESLNLLLSSMGGQSLLYDLQTLILDEIHAVVDSKRGVYLMSAVERLVPMSGEFQRIALSATVNPLDVVAEFVAGFERIGDEYSPRKIETLVSSATKDYEICIRYPEQAATRGEEQSARGDNKTARGDNKTARGDNKEVWDYLAEDILPRINHNQSTLIFVNSRALCEKLTFKLNAAAGRVVAYSHHGSLSREIRTEVETRLKEGKLDAIVATSTLEMGIDIGALDEVILVQSPGSIASTIQRIGRAGHQVGVPSRCTIYPTHPQDFIEAAVLASSVKAKALEPVTTISNPLDVLGQVIISMTGTFTWDIDELFAELRRSTAYNSLTRLQFDLVVNMLLGRYADHHIRELKPRVRIDRTNNTVEARKGALLSLYLSGGVIPDRGYFQLRHEGDNARIGELDEEFVWEASVGQVFSLGTQTWQVKKITHNDVIVGPAKPGSSAPPFWKAEPINRSFEYSEKIGEFLEAANDSLEEDDFQDVLQQEHFAEAQVADEIISFLKRQKEHCNCPLPNRHHVVFERIRSGPARASGQQLVIHTGWGARVNRPLAMALEAAWQERFSEQPEVFVANESVVLQLAHEVSASELLEMIPAHRLEELLRIRLEGSGFFGARFRESAGRSLLLSKGRFNERKPLWMSRLQSQKLMDSVLKYEDFPILLETWRTCLQDEFDIEHLKQMLHEIESRQITVTDIESATPSPFAQSVAWDQVNTYMYMSDTPKASKTSNLSDDLLKEVVFNPDSRPEIRPAVIEEFVTRQQRLESAYLPVDDEDLEDWIKERSLIPEPEWRALVSQLSFEPSKECFTWIDARKLVVSNDDYETFSQLLDTAGDADASEKLEVLVSNWLQYYGPVTDTFIAESLGLEAETITSILNTLIASNVLVEGLLVKDDSQHHFCDATNFEYLLRIQRARARPVIDALPVEALSPFMHAWQTRFSTKDPLDQLYDCMERLRGLPLAAALWETEVLPARLPGYDTSHLDLLFQEGDLQWLGVADKTVTFCLNGDLDLFSEPGAGSSLITDPHARYDFTGLLDKTGLGSADLAEQLWNEVWRGEISNDSVQALRKGIQNNFRLPEPASNASRSRRGAFNRWRGAMPLAGNWYRVVKSDDELELLEQQELDKDRIRLMMARYGIVFRELCQRELPEFRWQAMFRALRLMELAGEVVSGHFFEGIQGPQYMTAASLRAFQELDAGKVFFINAADPVSVCGLGLGAHGDNLPRRVSSNYMVYQGTRLAMTVARKGKDLQFMIGAEEPGIAEYLEVLHHLVYRSMDPLKQLRIETINGDPAVSSSFRPCIESRFNTYPDHKALIIQREL